MFTLQSLAFWFQDFPVLRLLPIFWVSVSVSKNWVSEKSLSLGIAQISGLTDLSTMPTLRMLAKSHVSKTPDIKESLGVIRGGRVVLEQVLVGLHPLLHCFCVLWSVF